MRPRWCAGPLTGSWGGRRAAAGAGRPAPGGPAGAPGPAAATSWRSDPVRVRCAPTAGGRAGRAAAGPGGPPRRSGRPAGRPAFGLPAALRRGLDRLPGLRPGRGASAGPPGARRPPAAPRLLVRLLRPCAPPRPGHRPVDVRGPRHPGPGRRAAAPVRRAVPPGRCAGTAAARRRAPGAALLLRQFRDDPVRGRAPCGGPPGDQLHPPRRHLPGQHLPPAGGRVRRGPARRVLPRCDPAGPALCRVRADPGRGRGEPVAGAVPAPRGTTVQSQPIKGTRPGPPASHRAAAAGAAGAVRQGPGGERDDRRPDAQRPRPGLRARAACGCPRCCAPKPAPACGIWSRRCADAAAGTRGRELLARGFPPGSVTGAPKVRALGIIHELEATPREVYTGAVGYRSPVAGWS